MPSAPTVYTDYDRFLQFPLAFGGSYTNNYASPGQYCHADVDLRRLRTTITPLGTFTEQMKNSDGSYGFSNERDPGGGTRITAAGVVCGNDRDPIFVNTESTTPSIMRAEQLP